MPDVLAPAHPGGCDGGVDERSRVVVGTGPVTPEQLVAVARHGAGVALSDEALDALAASRAVVDALADDAVPHYGISTGLRRSRDAHIPTEQRAGLQRSLIRSHAAGSGPEVEREVVRALMLLRLSTLATGRTGVRPTTAQAYAAMLNAGLTPVVHEYGSLGLLRRPRAARARGAGGDGGGRRPRRRRHPAPAATRSPTPASTPVVLAEKEGLALINGTDGMLGMLVLALHDLATCSPPPTSPRR